tara:strand:+ start:297 stop:449 length:153 start_codon:yes stop_codon:yes gene_type:complete
LNVAPSEAWKLDFIEVNKLLKKKNNGVDTSIMLNYERVKNGASKEWLQNP